MADTVIDAQLVKTLREKTNAGLMECKRALAETNGEIEAAVDVLRKKGTIKAGEKSDREAKEGVIALRDHPDLVGRIRWLVRRGDLHAVLPGVYALQAEADTLPREFRL